MLDVLRRILRSGILSEPLPAAATATAPPEHPLQDAILAVLGRALNIRHVDAGSCNGCELEIHALNNPYYNLEGAGIRFVASPRHADLLLVTGPLATNMEIALQRTYAATPDPKRVVAVGDCAAGCGLFGESYACRGRIDRVIPVDITVTGCPPTPTAILAGILAAVRVPPPLKKQK